MTDTPIDMHLPESFHRLKRTALLFSAALFVLGLAKPATDRELHSGFLDLTLATSAVQWLLWLGALYYLTGFWLEVETARRLNSQAMRGHGVTDFEARLRQMGAALEGKTQLYLEFIEGAPVQVARRLEELDRDLEHARAVYFGTDMIQNSVRQKAEEAGIDPARSLTVAGNIVGFVTSQYAEFAQRISRAEMTATALSDGLEQWRGAAEASMTAQRELKSDLDGLATRLKRLHRDITGARRASFWFWEVGGAVVAFIAATVVGLPWASITAWVEGLLPSGGGS